MITTRIWIRIRIRIVFGSKIGIENEIWNGKKVKIMFGMGIETRIDISIRIVFIVFILG